MASQPRPPGRIRMPPMAPAPVVDVVPDPTPVVPAPTPTSGQRPTGRIRMPAMKAALPEPTASAAPIASEIVVEAFPAAAPVPDWLRRRVLVYPPKPWPRGVLPRPTEACGPPAPPLPPQSDADSAAVLRALGCRT